MACLNRASSKISMISISSSLELLVVFQFASGKFRSPQIRTGFDFGMVFRSFWKSLILYRMHCLLVGFRLNRLSLQICLVEVCRLGMSREDPH